LWSECTKNDGEVEEKGQTKSLSNNEGDSCIVRANSEAEKVPCDSGGTLKGACGQDRRRRENVNQTRKETGYGGEAQEIVF